MTDNDQPATPATLHEAATRLKRVDEGESIASVYPDHGGGECSTTLVDTELLADAWIEEHFCKDVISVPSVKGVNGQPLPDLTGIPHACEFQRQVKTAEIGKEKP